MNGIVVRTRFQSAILLIYNRITMPPCGIDTSEATGEVAY